MDVNLLSKALLEQLKGPMDARDIALCEKLGKQIKDETAAAIADFEKKYARHRVPGLPNDANEVKDFSFARLIHGITMRDVEKYAPHEFEMCTAALSEDGAPESPMYKDMVAGTDTAGGFLVPAQVFQSQVLPLLQAQVIATQAGVTRIPNLTGSPVEMPKITGATTTDGVGETEAPNASDMTLGQLKMYPHDCFGTVKLSNRLIRHSMPGADLIVRRQLVRDLGLKIDRWVFSGIGSTAEPIGCFNATGIGAVTSFGSLSADTAYDKLIDMEGTIMDANALSLGGTPTWVMHTSLFRKIRKIKDPTDNSQPKARRLIDEGAPKTILGYPYALSTQLPTNAFMLGVFSTVLLGEWDTMIIAASNESGNNFLQRTTQILVGMTVDTGFQYPEALCKATGVT